MLFQAPKKLRTSHQLKRILVSGTALGVLTTSTLVALVSCVPLIRQLRAGEGQNLHFALQTRELAVEEFIRRAKDTGQQIASRTKVRQELEAYLDGERSFSEMQAAQQVALADAMNNAQDVAAIVRFTAEGEQAIALGIPVPSDLLDLRTAVQDNPVVQGPFDIEGRQFLLIFSPIFNTERDLIGIDAVAFRTKSLQRLVEDYTGLGQTGEMVLAVERGEDVELIFPLRSGQQPTPELVDALQQSLATPERSSSANPTMTSSTEMIVHRGVTGADWGMAVRMAQQELYAPVNRQVSLTAIATLLLSSGCTAGLLLLLRPLLHRVADAEDLQAQVEQKEAALDQLQRTQSQLIQSEKMSGLGQMVAGIAHEINNPVSFIHGNLKVAQQYSDDLIRLIYQYQQDYPVPSDAVGALLDEMDLEFVQQDYPKIFASMHTGTSRIRDIVRSLRTFSRLDEAALKTVDVNAGLDSVLLLLQSRCENQAGQPEISILRCYGNLPAVECFPNQLNQACFNILTNAIDALQQSEPSGCQIRISTTQCEDNRIVITIADNGPGIDPVIQTKIFDPFFTTKPVGNGTGMGLAVSYNIIVEEHGGELTCQSQLGKGCTFVIKIPLTQQPQTSQQLAAV